MDRYAVILGEVGLIALCCPALPFLECPWISKDLIWGLSLPEHRKVGSKPSRVPTSKASPVVQWDDPLAVLTSF